MEVVVVKHGRFVVVAQHLPPADAKTESRRLTRLTGLHHSPVPDGWTEQTLLRAAATPDRPLCTIRGQLPPRR